MKPTAKMTQRAKKSNTISVFIIVSICVVLGVALLLGSKELANKNEDYRVQIQGVQNKIDGESQRSEEIAKYGEYVQTPEFVERIARERFGLVYKDEYVIKAEN